MNICTGFARYALAVTGVVVGAGPSAAATASASFGVSATVIAACTVAPTPWVSGPVCLNASHSETTPVAPVIRFSRAPGRGALVQTVEF